MNSLVVINIYIVLLHLLILVNPTTAICGLGDSSCRYSGNFDSDNVICHKDVVKIGKLPKECTAFVFDGVTCNKNYEISYRWIPEDLDHLKSLIDFEDGAHNVYLFYKHQTLADWSNALFFGDFQIEAQKVQEFIGIYPVKGLILDGMEDPVLSEVQYTTDNFI
ncbi:uncharacterized protein LOC115034264 [Acyrthosiphon pisum]|uniref:Uncharacterized protein n=1 Tax=Acyrthosiphon pisum TaxID=7029 RepID=A0A8R2JTR7_ACYPI|nr:uncharacterized protein LOC115034264 [Acyrthosiphon pisum]